MGVRRTNRYNNTQGGRHALPSFLFTLLLALVVTAGCGQNQQNTGTTANQATAAPAAGAGEATAAPASATSDAAQAATAPAATGATGAATAPALTEDSFQNPVLRADFADPGVLKVGDTFYAYATNAIGKNVQVARSTDLVKWEQLPDAMPALASWARPGGSLVWAPEVVQVGEQFLLYYTARDKASDKQCIGVAISAKPEGRFKDPNDKPFICQADQGGSIDASPFYDGDKLYLYWKNDGNCCLKPTYLYVQELTPDGLSLVGEPTQLVRNDAPWEGTLVEAPTMIKRDEAYYLFFSANGYAGPLYAVGYAVCESAIGPCQDAPENPILKSRMDQKPLVMGPGHQAIVQIEDETWILYHAWEITSAGLRGNRRFMFLDELEWQDGKPVMQGPTTDPQPKPLE